MICFPYNAYKNCWRYNGEKTVTAETSVNFHKYGKLGHIGEYLLAIGDYHDQATVELFDGQAWRHIGPFLASKYYYFDTLTVADKTYTIGGYIGPNQPTDSVYVGILETFPVTRVTW